MTDDLGTLLQRLESGDEEEIVGAVGQLPQRIEQIVELPPKQVARVLRALLVALDADVETTIRGIYRALDQVISKVSDKHQIAYPKDISISYEYVIGVLESGEFPRDG